MLKFFWDEFGTQLWSAIHLEYVLGFIMHKNWAAGLRFIMESKVTQTLVASLRTSSRCFFIENQIGDFMSEEKQINDESSGDE